MADREFDVVVVGAGFAGMYMLHRLRGMGLAVRVLEAGSGVGPWLMLPVVPVILVVLAFNFFGDGLRDAADPYT
jgi:flavin-dependent dehydrogenase